MKPKAKYKAGDVVVCTHQYCGHYGELGIVVSSHWARSCYSEYVTVQFDYSENCGSSLSFFGNLPGSLEVIDKMPDLVGLTPTQIHEVLNEEAEKLKNEEEEEGRIRASLHEFNMKHAGPPVVHASMSYKGYVLDLSTDAWGPMLTMKCGTCGRGEVRRLDTIFPELRGAS